MDPCISEKEYNRFIEDALSAEELVRLKMHAKECKACHAELEEWKSLKASLVDMAEVEVPVSLKEKVMNEVRKESILPAPQPLGLKRIMTAVSLLLIMAAYYFFPALKPYTAAVTKEIVTYLSELGYNLLGFAGIDIKSVVALIKAVIPVLNDLFAVFAVSTLMLIVGFFSLILKGNAKLKAN